MIDAETVDQLQMIEQLEKLTLEVMTMTSGLHRRFVEMDQLRAELLPGILLAPTPVVPMHVTSSLGEKAGACLMCSKRRAAVKLDRLPHLPRKSRKAD